MPFTQQYLRTESCPLDIHGMRLDVGAHVLVDPSGREINLTRGELAILVALARRPGQVLSRDQLLDAMSGRNATAFDRSIDNLIVRLRRKIEDEARNPRLILTVRGAGYKLAIRPERPNVASRPPSTDTCPVLFTPVQECHRRSGAFTLDRRAVRAIDGRIGAFGQAENSLPSRRTCGCT